MNSFRQPSLHNQAAAPLAWYYHRLRAMSLAEMRHRAIEALKRTQSRYVRSGWGPFDIGDGSLPGLTPELSLFETISDEMIDEMREVAWRVQRGDIELLGTVWPPRSGQARWHLDPVTGGEWPSDRYCFDVPFRHERELGDIKYVWELNRLQYLQPMAAYAAHSEDAEIARFCHAEIESWIDANAPFRGVNWASGIELALRVVSILVVWGFVGGHATHGQRRKVRACLNAHAYWLERFPSRYSSANNHLVAECGALFLLGSLWPDLGLSEQAAAAQRTLDEEVTRLIYEDGVGAEQSPTYTAFLLEWYLLCIQTANSSGTPFRLQTLERLGKAGEFLRYVMDEADAVPRIGDDDEGRVIADVGSSNKDYVASILGGIAETLGCANVAPRRVAPSFRGMFIGLPKSGADAPEGAKTFTYGGYSVFRRKTAGRRVLMVMDHGPLGYLSISAHGHADSLAVWLHIDDQPIFVDAGTYLYHSGGHWRDEFRGTALHNTLCLDGQNSSLMAGAFNWKRKANAQQTEWLNDAQECSVAARHDGYVESHGLLHQRKIVANDTGFVVRDSLVEASGSRDQRRAPRLVEISFLVDPALTVAVNGLEAKIMRDGEALLSIKGSKALSLSVADGGNDPVRGWHSERFGSLSTTNQIIFQARGTTNLDFEIQLDVVAPSECGLAEGR